MRPQLWRGGGGRGKPRGALSLNQGGALPVPGGGAGGAPRPRCPSWGARHKAPLCGCLPRTSETPLPGGRWDGRRDGRRDGRQGVRRSPAPVCVGGSGRRRSQQRGVRAASHLEPAPRDSGTSAPDPGALRVEAAGKPREEETCGAATRVTPCLGRGAAGGRGGEGGGTGVEARTPSCRARTFDFPEISRRRG